MNLCSKGNPTSGGRLPRTLNQNIVPGVPRVLLQAKRTTTRCNNNVIIIICGLRRESLYSAGPSWADNNIVDSPHINGEISRGQNPPSCLTEYVFGVEEGT